MRAFCPIAGGGWPSGPARPGSRATPRPPWAARPGFSRPGRVSRSRSPASPVGGEAGTAAILVSSPASCRGWHHERVSALARAKLGKYSLDHVGQPRLAPAGPPFYRTGDSCQPATFRRARASVCWRSCYPILLAPKVGVSTVVQLGDLVEGTAPCRDPDGSANSSQCWAPMGPPKPNRAGRD